MRGEGGDIDSGEKCGRHVNYGSPLASFVVAQRMVLVPTCPF
ncbi:hypothetical protein, unlikely [Trypanosoma brucei brucei TREU927]|uniref:Uncharacterized protein n=1 Tax=Trypanosoma brucei brucei (strain 927/4 GUTat10.1) TaxID=185431 RepID=Q38EW6_TRYB2|nr:hypothetical protein, unlikely [Trypanosoma brucei brucei TREU927]EAN76654.1 hypothetical protein, unlikely [Trypanosoma brucei brucei TREU927]